MAASDGEGGKGEESLEALIEKSLRIKPLFEKTHPAGAEAAPKTLIERLLPLSAAAANAVLSSPGNPAYAPAAVGALTYILASKTARLAKLNSKISTATYGLGPSFASNVLFQFKGLAAIVSGMVSFAIPYSAKSFGDETGSSLDWFAELAKSLPSFAPEIAYGTLSGFGTYVLLTGLQHVAHPQSLLTAWHMLRKNPEKMAGIPHSKEKEIGLLLQMGDAFLDSKNFAGAAGAYKGLLQSAMRTDGKTGISDWLVGRAKNVQAYGTTIPNPLQQAMHEFAAGNHESAHSLLAYAIRIEPNNRDLHRIRALFFQVLGEKSAADLEMRIFVELARRDAESIFELVGESRNRVLTIKGGRTRDIYVKEGPASSFDDEARNISEFSREIPGRLPSVVGMCPADAKGKAAMAVESMGNATMLQKAITGNLTAQDVESTIDLLLEVLTAGEKLRKQGKIKVAEPISLPTYIYSSQTALKSLGRNAVQENVHEENGTKQTPLYFAHRVNDLFVLGVQEHNGIEFTQEFADKVMNGAAVLNYLLLEHPLIKQGTLNGVYTDFTHRNIIFDSLSGALKGKIDWEQIKVLPVMFELVNILEFYRVNFSASQIESFQKYFVNRFEHASGAKISMSQFSFLYHTAAAIRHLELISYRSRDAAFNPENASAQAYHHLMARMHLVEVIAKAPITQNHPARAALEEMLQQLDMTPIMKDARQQKELESEVRLHATRAGPSMRYLAHEASQKAYWKDFFSPPQNFLRRPHLTNTPYRKASVAENLASNASVIIGVPAALATAGTFDTALYFALQTIMPSL
ncbi:hypothetical protein HYU17_00635 [Candidatus Woesearchaeota archaeon]|nr:hypothetical protein [Candidatus Woesearchaeota archaeon]